VTQLSKPAAVTFDLWRTLIFEFGKKENSAQRRELRADYGIAALTEMGESIDRAEFYRVFVDISDEITAGHDDENDSHYGEWIRLGLSRIDSGLPDRIGIFGVTEVGAAIDRSFIDSPPTLLDGAMEVLDGIAERGLGIGMVTNTGLTSGGAFRDWFADIGLLGKFGHIAYSNEMGTAKPNRMMFDATLRALGVVHERALHVGDNLFSDVAGAAATGMSTVWAAGDSRPDSKKTTEPDYTVETVVDLLPVVDNWLETLEG
jgi:HAD superfamily hydrolase (TIGR01509 family)